MSIGKTLTAQQTAICWPTRGEFMIARHPDTVFLSFTATNSPAKVLIKSFFTKTVQK